MPPGPLESRLMKPEARHLPTVCWALAVALSASVLVLSSCPLRATDHEADVASIVERHNAHIRRALGTIESLSVQQDMYEPQADGRTLHARAVLQYAAAEGMTREVLASNLSYPAGEYTLATLVGPSLDPSEYRVRLDGEETLDGVDCYRLAAEAIVRDRHHLDGHVWVSRVDCSLVRVSGRVSAPPFPITEILLDKRFAPGPSGFSLLRSHAGEVRAGLVLGRKRGARNISYSAYVINGTAEDGRPR